MLRFGEQPMSAAVQQLKETDDGVNAALSKCLFVSTEEC